MQIKSRKNFWRVLSKCLKFNSNNLELWKIGIYYEFEINNNPFKARQLFLKGIKSNSKDANFWLAYLQFEAKFIKLVEERDKVLNMKGLDSKATFDDDFLGFQGEDNEDGN